MRNARLWHALFGVVKTIVEAVEFDEDAQVLVGRVRPARAAALRCGVCQRRCGRYDSGEGRRRWRALDLGTVQAVIEADAPRVSCPEHGVVVAHVPWARHGAGHTLAFDETVAWVGHPDVQKRGHPVDAHRLADGRVDHRPGLGRHRRITRSVRRSMSARLQAIRKIGHPIGPYTAGSRL